MPVVVLARIGRDWSLFRPGDMLDWNLHEGRARWVTGLGLVFYYPLLLVAIGGVVVMKLRKRAAMAIADAAVDRHRRHVARATARPASACRPSRALVVLAAVGIAALVARWWPERTDEPSPTDDDPEPTLVSGSV